jgi:hypothetical protein
VREIPYRRAVQVASGELGATVHQLGNDQSEPLFDVVEGNAGNVFDNIVQQRGGQEKRILETKLSGENLSDCARVADVRRTGLPALTRVEVVGELKRIEKYPVVHCFVEVFGNTSSIMVQVEI